MTEEKLHWFKCPKCGSLGRVDEEQNEGRMSIVCTECGWHGYKEKPSLKWG